MAEIKHACFSARGKNPDCQQCSINQHGYCDIFLDYISKKIGGIKSEFPLMDQDDIISLYVIQVQKQMHQFRGNRANEFRGWIKTILKGTKKDYFRKQENMLPLISNIESDISEQIATIISEIIEPIIEVFYEMIAKQKDPGGCCQLFLNYYEWCKEGINQIEMAGRYNLKTNTYNQRLSRCRKKIADLLEKKGISQLIFKNVTADINGLA